MPANVVSVMWSGTECGRGENHQAKSTSSVGTAT